MGYQLTMRVIRSMMVRGWVMDDDIIITFSFVPRRRDQFWEMTMLLQTLILVIRFGNLLTRKRTIPERRLVPSLTLQIFIFMKLVKPKIQLGTFRFGMTDHALNGNKEAAGWAFGPGGSSANGDVWIANYDDTDPDAYAAAMICRREQWVR